MLPSDTKTSSSIARLNRSIRQGARELAALFRDPDRPPVFLVGAGASYRAGVPVAAEAVWWIIERYFSRNVSRGQFQSPRRSEIEMWLRKEHAHWFDFDPEKLAENFPEVVDHLLFPAEFRREVLHDLVQPRNGINDGHKHLARLMQRGLCRTVLTTNFDRLVHSALKAMEPHVRHVVEVNQVPGDFDQFSLLRKFQVVYLHGSVEHYRDRNTRRETADLDRELEHLVEPLLRDWPLIVVGYRGAEASIMEGLLGNVAAGRTAFRNGLYWCSRQNAQLHPRVDELARRIGKNFRHVVVEGFDELLAELDFLLRDVDHFGKGFEVTAPEPTPDESPLPQGRMDEIDHDLALATLTRWASRLHRGAVKSDNFEALMLELRLAAKQEGQVVPTLGGLLLFGRKPQTRFPHAYVRVLVGHTQRIVDGNLIEQFRTLREIIGASDINPILRIKGPESSEDRLAYPQRVLTETIVNMLVHRDYRIEDFAEIAVTPGQSIRFVNPGGLPKDVFARVAPNSQGHFNPIREATQIRNPCLADIFFGDGSMDREGSGLADVLVMSRENGGDAEFSVHSENTRFAAELRQPYQASPASSMLARPISASGRYITNHLPFQVIPDTIYSIPVRDRPTRSHDLPPSLFGEKYDTAPSMEIRPVYSGGFKVGRLYSFANFADYPRFSEQRGFANQMVVHSRTELESDADGARIVSWLLRRHFDYFLGSFASVGLCTDGRRAYFLGAENEERAIIYDSAKRRGVRRVMVKRREIGKRVFHENEGIWYSVERFAGAWCIRLKPTYVFTEADGTTPLPPFMVSRLATRRFRFDRNKNVDDDMTFWVRLLGRGKPVAGLAAPGVSDLILSLDYIGFEVPEVGISDEHPD